jgi:hypothetical protein
MDHDMSVGPRLYRGQSLIENISHAPDLHSVAPASLVVFARLRAAAPRSGQTTHPLADQQRGISLPTCAISMLL